VGDVCSEILIVQAPLAQIHITAFLAENQSDIIWQEPPAKLTFTD
jgi:hypothetical protein